MTAIAKVGTPSLASVLPPANAKDSGGLAGEAIAAADALYIKNDGTVWRSTGAAANAAAKVRGYAGVAAQVGEAVTLIADVVFRYGSGLTPGSDVYLSGTVAGGLDTAASTGGTAPIGYVLFDGIRIRLRRSSY